MKIVAIAENEEIYESMTRDKILGLYHGTADKYDTEVKVILDHAMIRDGGGSMQSAMLKVEKEGPSWVKNDPEVLEEVADADVVLVHFEGVGPYLLDAAKNLKLVAVMRSGVENVDIPACEERGVMVCNAPGRLEETVSDFTCAMILDINRGITYVNRFWQPGTGDSIRPYFQPELYKDITLGIVGFGFIGRAVAHKLANFNMKMIAYDPFVSQEVADEYGVKMVSLEEVMSQADTVTVHARLLPETENMINADLINSMKPSAFFVSTARAGLHDEPALIKALQEKRIRGAALDVFWEEPLPDDHPLRKLDNVILTPHIAGGGGDSFAISTEIILKQIEMFLQGGTPASLMKPSK